MYELLVAPLPREVSIASTDGEWQSRVQWSMWLLCMSKRASFCCM